MLAGCFLFVYLVSVLMMSQLAVLDNLLLCSSFAITDIGCEGPGSNVSKLPKVQGQSHPCAAMDLEGVKIGYDIRYDGVQAKHLKSGPAA